LRNTFRGAILKRRINGGFYLSQPISLPVRKSLLFAGLWLGLAACHKADDGPSIDFGPGEGISYQDANNLPVGYQDPTDWTADATWNEQEQLLFSELSLSLDGPPQTGIFYTLRVFPNPGATATWGLQSQLPTSSPDRDFAAVAVLVDRSYRVLQRFPRRSSTTGAYALSLDYAKLGLNPGERYRLYYVLSNTKGLICKGHGDIRYDKP
jgi:hypothetical protein